MSRLVHLYTTSAKESQTLLYQHSQGSHFVNDRAHSVIFGVHCFVFSTLPKQFVPISFQSNVPIHGSCHIILMVITSIANSINVSIVFLAFPGFSLLFLSLIQFVQHSVEAVELILYLFDNTMDGCMIVQYLYALRVGVIPHVY